MHYLETIFWISLFIILYTYAGYALILYAGGALLKWTDSAKTAIKEPFAPSLTLIVAAYNEASCIKEKIENTLSLQYPNEKIRFIFVTDGSTDETPVIVAQYPQLKLLHIDERSGKIHAVQRAMKEVETEIVVFTDANSMINTDALLHICRHYREKNIGAVAGEKRIDITHTADATVGEGLYWQYESTLKKWESAWYSALGAAGELFSIRAALYEPVASDTLLDDFMISIKIAMKGYLIRYEPRAYAVEKGSASIREELKRKIRIATGGVQTLLRLPGLLLPFKHPWLSFAYISHRVLRWVITPYLLIAVFVLNTLLVSGPLYLTGLLAAQFLFYGIALLGWILEKRQLKNRKLFIPYYFCLMNYAMIAGMYRYLFARQTVLWEKVNRK